jgi:hypothetical protein
MGAASSDRFSRLLSFIADRRPTYAGIDPYNYYIARNPGDNLQPLPAGN